jgi:hypothetical protein
MGDADRRLEKRLLVKVDPTGYHFDNLLWYALYTKNLP